MDIEDLEPRAKKQTFQLLVDLSGFSIEELEDRIHDLEDEIARCREVISSKKVSRADAESVFKI